MAKKIDKYLDVAIDDVVEEAEEISPQPAATLNKKVDGFTVRYDETGKVISSTPN